MISESSELMANRRAWLWVLVASTVLSQTALNVFRPVTSYKLLDLGASDVLIGAVTAAFALIPLIIALPVGRFADTSERLHRVIACAAALLSLGGVVLAATSSIPLVFAASAVLGLGHLLFTISGQTTIARRSAPETLDGDFGYFTAAFSVGQLIGPLIAGGILGSRAQATEITTALAVGSAAALLAAVLALASGHGRRPPELTTAETPSPDPDAVEDKPSVRAVLRIPGVPSHITASLLLLVMIDLLTAYLPLVGERAGVTPAAVGVLLAVRSAASFASRLMLSRLVLRYGREPLIASSLLVAGFALAGGTSLAGHLWVAGVLFVIGGFFLGLGQPITMALITQTVPAHWRGTALATRLLGNRLGQVAIPALAGLLAAPVGPAGPIWAACACLIVSGVEQSVRASTLRRSEG